MKEVRKLSNRIRYEKTTVPGVIVSVRSYNVGERTFRVRINDNTLVFDIYDVNNMKIYDRGASPSASALRLKAKRSLMNLGVEFQDEIRKPRSKIEDPNTTTAA